MKNNFKKTIKTVGTVAAISAASIYSAEACKFMKKEFKHMKNEKKADEIQKKLQEFINNEISESFKPDTDEHEVSISKMTEIVYRIIGDDPMIKVSFDTDGLNKEGIFNVKNNQVFYTVFHVNEHGTYDMYSRYMLVNYKPNGVNRYLVVKYVR